MSHRPGAQCIQRGAALLYHTLSTPSQRVVRLHTWLMWTPLTFPQRKTAVWQASVSLTEVTVNRLPGPWQTDFRSQLSGRPAFLSCNHSHSLTHSLTRLEANDPKSAPLRSPQDSQLTSQSCRGDTWQTRPQTPAVQAVRCTAYG